MDFIHPGFSLTAHSIVEINQTAMAREQIPLSADNSNPWAATVQIRPCIAQPKRNPNKESSS